MNDADQSSATAPAAPEGSTAATLAAGQVLTAPTGESSAQPVVGAQVPNPGVPAQTAVAPQVDLSQQAVAPPQQPPAIAAQPLKDDTKPPESSDEHQSGILAKLIAEVKLMKIRRETLKVNELILKEDRLIQHIEGYIATLRQFRL